VLSAYGLTSTTGPLVTNAAGIFELEKSTVFDVSVLEMVAVRSPRDVFKRVASVTFKVALAQAGPSMPLTVTVVTFNVTVAKSSAVFQLVLVVVSHKEAVFLWAPHCDMA
jgi:hypothetical protein